ncbi:hypothetical protein ATN37_03325 [Rhodococcus sp. MH15]|nr:hypothetical protein [Rhodococcus sp. MH15]
MRRQLRRADVVLVVSFVESTAQCDFTTAASATLLMSSFRFSRGYGIRESSGVVVGLVDHCTMRQDLAPI